MNFLNYLKAKCLLEPLRNQGSNFRFWSAKKLCFSLTIVILSLIVILNLFLFSCVPKKRIWINTDQSGPSARDDHEMVYDSFRKKIVLFGGWDGGDMLGDTWEWDGIKWSSVNFSGPEARISHSMTYDTRRKKVVLFGGRNGELFGDTWEWDGQNWENINISGPSGRCDHAMAYDMNRERILLFGGIGGGVGAIVKGEEIPSPKTIKYEELGYSTTIYGGNSENCKWFGDTWELNGQSWVKKSDSGPSARYNHAMAYDSKRKKVVLFGGIGKDDKLLGDTWEWDGKSWQKISDSGPEPRFGHSLVYDNISSKIILFGGSISEYLKSESKWDHIISMYQKTYSIIRIPMDDIWELDGNIWQKSEYSVPSSRYFHSMSFDDKKGRIVVFGGHGPKERLGDTWEYR